ncbi:hypothetical protein CR969_02045 [Candidatus Saccharibacteria bacterium]|nr:MAG: hypothetical protein CR969_02045 [Candidatus Saccharibacteria bacterium]
MVNKRLKYLIISIIIFLLIVIVSVVFYLSQPKENPYGEELTISNLSDYTKGKFQDPDALNKIKHELFKQVKRNSNTDIQNDSVKDIMVRDGSFSQTYDNSRKYNLVEMIVDIESLKQSYLVNYEWAGEGGKDDGFGQYGILVSCLPVDQLIYGDFDCQDLGSDMRGSSKPYVIIEWSDAKDQYGNTLFEQLQPSEISKIEDQIINKYMAKNKLERITNYTTVKDVKRITKGNSINFTVTVNQKSDYLVSVYFNTRQIKVVEK